MMPVIDQGLAGLWWPLSLDHVQLYSVPYPLLSSWDPRPAGLTEATAKAPLVSPPSEAQGPDCHMEVLTHACLAVADGGWRGHTGSGLTCVHRGMDSHSGGFILELGWPVSFGQSSINNQQTICWHNSTKPTKTKLIFLDVDHSGQ